MDIGKTELREIICETLKIPKTTPLIESHIHKYVMELGLTYKEIAQALVYYIEVTGGEYIPMYGLGIVPNVLPEAKKYFEQKRREKEEQIKSIEEAKKQPDIILYAKHIRKRKAIQPIDIEKLDIE